MKTEAIIKDQLNNRMALNPAKDDYDKGYKRALKWVLED